MSASIAQVVMSCEFRRNNNNNYPEEPGEVSISCEVRGPSVAGQNLGVRGLQLSPKATFIVSRALCIIRAVEQLLPRW